MEVKKRIISKATELFMKEGVRRVTMDQLSAALGMSKRTIYEIYSNKDAILRECIENHIYQQREITNEMAKKAKTVMHLFLMLLRNGLEDMKSQNPQFINDVRIYYPSIWSSTICANQEYSLDLTSKLLQKGIDEGVFRGDIHIPITSKFLNEIITLLANTDLFPTHIYPPSILYESTMITIIRGISTAKGLAIVEEFYKKMESSDNSSKSL